MLLCFRRSIALTLNVVAVFAGSAADHSVPVEKDLAIKTVFRIVGRYSVDVSFWTADRAFHFSRNYVRQRLL